MCASNKINISKNSIIKDNDGYCFIHAKEVNICDSILEINDGRLLINSSDLNLNAKILSDNTKIDVEKCKINNSDVLSNGVFIRSDYLMLNKTKIESYVIGIGSQKVDNKENSLLAHEAIIINDSNYDRIDSVISPIIIYNGLDVSNSNSVMLSKKRQDLRKAIINLEEKTNEILFDELNRFIDSQNEKPVSLVLKK